MDFEEMVVTCSVALMLFEQKGIRVIKCGLHASDGVEGEMVAGFYHPAFRELCESELYRIVMTDKIFEKAREKGVEYNCRELGSCLFAVNPACISKALGHKKSNVKCLKEYFGIDIKVVADENIAKYQCEIRG